MHMHPGYFLLFCLAAVCFVALAFDVQIIIGRRNTAAPRVLNLLGLGLLFWLLVPLIIRANH